MVPQPPTERPLVLVVDDVPDIRLAYRMMLEADEFRVTEAWNGASAIEILKKEKVDVVLTDLYMPGTLDGIDLVRAVRDLPAPQPAVIAMSGSPHRAYRSSLQTARYVGADAAFRKPIGRLELVNTIRRLIGGGPALLPST